MFKKYIIIVLCTIMLCACGKSDSENTSNLVQSCQTTFNNWQQLTEKLEMNNNIPDYFLKSEKNDYKNMLKAISSLDEERQIAQCKVLDTSINKKLSALSADPKGLDDFIRKLDAQGNFKDFK